MHEIVTDPQRTGSTRAVPVSRRCDHVDEYHGVGIEDPYRWLEDAESDETRAWIAAQRRFTSGWIEGVPEREAIRARLAELWSVARRSVPVPRGERLFFSHNDGTRDQPVLMVMDSPVAEPRVLVDPAEGGASEAVFIAEWAPSRDGALLAWARSEAGSDWREWRVRDVATGRDHSEVIRWSKFSTVAWNVDSTGFYYEWYEAPADRPLTRPNPSAKIRFHRLGTKQVDDRVVWENDGDAGVRPNVFVGQDGRWVVLRLRPGRSEGNEIRLIDLHDVTAPPRPLVAGLGARVNVVAAFDDAVYALTDADAPNWRLVRLDPSLGTESPWTTIIPESDASLHEVVLAGDRFVALHVVDAASRLSVFGFDGAPMGELPLPDPVAAAMVRGQATSPVAYFEMQAFARPPEVLKLDVHAMTVSPWWRPRLRFDPARFITRRAVVTGRDGAQIPVFLVHRSDVPERSDLPTYQYGYGGFNTPMLPRYGVSTLTWLEMGGLLVFAAVRGGGERGAAWHRGGMGHARQNVFDDFMAVSEWLIESGWTSRAKLAIAGHSNGGLLVGACLTQRPDLYAAALPGAGVLDMLRFPRFTIGWAWTSEYGTPDDPADFPVLLGYSPLHRVVPGTAYPATLVTASEGDDRVVPCHSYKFTAALQAAQAGEAPILLRIEPRAGHGAGTAVSQLVAEHADRLAFLVRVLGMRRAALGSDDPSATGPS